MEKLKKNERVAALIKILSNNPNQVLTLNYFSELLNAAKSTISEDISAAKKIMECMDLGAIETISGALGGVKYKPIVSEKESRNFLDELCKELRDPARLIVGSFIYFSDIMCNPAKMAKIGEIFASHFIDQNADYVVTIETKGIAPAMMTARALNLPLVIARRDHRVTEGPTISINYVSGSSGRIQTMSISKKSIKEGSRVLVIDDFMKAGGTIKGLHTLMNEFKAEVVGTGVVMATSEPERKLIGDYYKLLSLNSVNESKKEIDIEIGI